MNIDDLLKFVESLATDHKPDGWPAIQMQEVTALADEVKRLRAENERILNHAVELSMTAPKGYVLVPVAELRQIEDAIAFELGGEPCGLHEAHKLVKAMIQAAQEGE